MPKDQVRRGILGNLLKDEKPPARLMAMKKKLKEILVVQEDRGWFEKKQEDKKE